MTICRNKTIQFFLFAFLLFVTFKATSSTIIVDTFTPIDQYDYLNSSPVTHDSFPSPLFQRFVTIPMENGPFVLDEISLAASHVSGPNDVFVDIFQGSVSPETLIASIHLVDELPMFSPIEPSPLPPPTTFSIFDDTTLEEGLGLEFLVGMRTGQSDSNIVWHHSLAPQDPVSLEAIRISVRPVPVPSALILMLTGILSLFASYSKRVI